MERSLKISFIINILITILTVFGLICMFNGFQFMIHVDLLNSNRLSMFKYFTIDSNILVGLSSFVLAVYEYLLLNNKINKIPNFIYILKYVGTCAVVLTFFVTLFWLTNIYKEQFYLLYVNSNLLFHLIIPLLSIISYVLFEKVHLNKKVIITGLIPMLIYGIYYLGMIFTHLDNGNVSFEYDFYGFIQCDIKYTFFVVIFLLVLMWLISLFIYKLNRRGLDVESK